MGLYNVFNVAGSSMSAQSVRLNTVASNLANADTVSTTEKDIYRSRQPVFAAVMQALGKEQASIPVRTAGIVESQAAARQVTHPVLFLMQLEDELFPRDGYLELFDALATEEKRLHANPGLHPEIPAEEVDFAFDFITGHLEGRIKPRIVNPLAE